MTDTLTLDSWRAVARLRADLDMIPISRPDEQLDALFAGAQRLLDAHRAFFIIGTRRRSPIGRMRRVDPIDGWYPTIYLSTTVDAQAQARIAAYAKKRSNYVDPFLKAIVERRGEHRAFLRSDLADDMPWREKPVTGELMRSLGSIDRLVGVCSLSETVECYLGVDRAEGCNMFEPADRDKLREVVCGLVPLCTRLAMSYGLHEHQQPLTARERETFLLLLGGMAEKAMADWMGVTAATVHQYVTRTYSKLAVNSRAELVEHWINAMEFAR